MGSMMKIVMSIIGISVALLLFPIIIQQANTLWTAATATYVGLRPLVQIAPIVILVGMIGASGWLGFSGVRGYRRKKKARR